MIHENKLFFIFVGSKILSATTGDVCINMQVNESFWLGVTPTEHGASLPPATVAIFKILAGPPYRAGNWLLSFGKRSVGYHSFAVKAKLARLPLKPLM